MVDISSTDPPIISTLTKLTYLEVVEMSDSLAFLQNLTQLQCLFLNNTQVNGSITALPQLTSLKVLFVQDSQVGVPTEQELATSPVGVPASLDRFGCLCLGSCSGAASVVLCMLSCLRAASSGVGPVRGRCPSCPAFLPFTVRWHSGFLLAAVPL